MPTAALWRFRELAAIRTGFPDFTLSVMTPLALSELGSVGQSLVGAPTLLRTIRDFQRLARTESSTATLDLLPPLRARLSREQQRLLNERAPTSLLVPSGHRATPGGRSR